MDVTLRTAIRVLVLAGGFFAAIPPASIADETAPLSKEIEGKWVRYLRTPDGRVTIVKEHSSDTTVLTATDDAGNVLYAHRSTFKVERSGQVKLFTILKRTITAGSGAGQETREPSSFVYRVSNDRFVEVHGLLEGDMEPASLVLWERMVMESK